MGWVRRPSTMDRRLRAPVCRSSALRAMVSRAPWEKRRSRPSARKRRAYCLSSAERGRLSTCTSSFSPREWSLASTGNLPRNSGRKPKETRSSTVGCSRSTCAARAAESGRAAAPNPICLTARRSSITLSRPLKAPPQMNRMLVVSTCTYSLRGFLRPPFSGTFTTEPSSILSRPCWTPSPDTSRKPDPAVARRAILSTSSR
mmetsp:Transcript_24015/g.70786  ORF Transcript_24015/g.70786 Transcript_24015/m.70786 type:complete len:202 (-) Transcript_24015:321-926(-)